MRRAYSWLGRSEKARADEEKFIFLWIAFNAAYGAESTNIEEHPLSENQQIKNFLHEVLKRDKTERIENILWEKYPEAILVLLKNRYLFKLFWRWIRDPSKTYNWSVRFDSNRTKIMGALEQRNTHVVLGEVLRRLYELRNQVFHGGMTFAEGWGRGQLRDGMRIMAEIVPAILDIMKAEVEANPASEVWGRVAYPRVYDEEHPEP